MDRGQQGGADDDMEELPPMSRFFFPELQGVEALAPYRLRTRWSTGEVLDVDVSGILHSLPGACPPAGAGDLRPGACGGMGRHGGMV